MARMKILISGGGIAGNVLAFWLSRCGHSVTVIERSSSLRETGLQVDLRGHGIQVLKRMGLDAAFRTHAVAEEGLEVVDRSGKRRAYFPANASGKGVQSFTSEYEIMRGDLVRLLYDANQGRVKYLFGTSITEYREAADPAGVEVTFFDKSIERYDLLVGADGQWSHTRKLMLGPDAPDPMHMLAGTYSGYFTMPYPMKKGEGYNATIYMTTKQRGIMTRRCGPDLLQVYIGCNTDDERLRNARRGDTETEKKVLTEIFRGAGWKTDDILDALHVSDDFYCERFGVVKLDSWYKGRVALVGDAAYCPTANTGMGTTSSFVGAYVLAGEIDRHCRAAGGESTNEESLNAALQSYDKLFRPFMNQVQKGVAEDKGVYLSSSLSITIFLWVASLLSMLRINVAALFLKEDVKNWELPEYKEMVQQIE